VIEVAYALLWVALLVYALYPRLGAGWPGWTATGVLIMGWIFLTAGLVERARLAGHWPLANRYEFSLCFTWAILTVYLLLEGSWRERRAGPFVLAVALLVATYAVTRPASDKTLSPLLPALRSVWLQVHVLTTLLGYGAFGVAAGLGLAGLRGQAALAWDEQGPGPLEEEDIERAIQRVVALGFPWLTLGILTGGIWAQKAWGRYWGWDPKETWALLLWLWYLLVLHVYTLRKWRGRRLAGLVVAGFALVLFTFIGVPWLVRTVRLESLHVF